MDGKAKITGILRDSASIDAALASYAKWNTSCGTPVECASDFAEEILKEQDLRVEDLSKLRALEGMIHKDAPERADRITKVCLKMLAVEAKDSKIKHKALSMIDSMDLEMRSYLLEIIDEIPFDSREPFMEEVARIFVKVKDEKTRMAILTSFHCLDPADRLNAAKVVLGSTQKKKLLEEPLTLIFTSPGNESLRERSYHYLDRKFETKDHVVEIANLVILRQKGLCGHKDHPLFLRASSIYIRPNTLLSLFEKMDRSLDPRALQSQGIDYENLKRYFTGKNIGMLMAFSGEKEDEIPLEAKQLFAILQYIALLPSKTSQEGGFSPQQKAFLEILSSIQKHSGGMEMGIKAAFNNLPREDRHFATTLKDTDSLWRD